MGESRGQRQTVVGYAGSMLTPELLEEWLPRLQHPAVRDLAWTLLAAPLLSAPACRQRHPLTASHWARHPDMLADWLQQQEQQPAALLDWLSNMRSQRLGMYYERLWQFALQQAPGIQLLAANLPIRQVGKTLGELDLLLRDAEGVQHLELAIKLYLGPANGDGRLVSNWRGAGRADNLERKLQHLLLQQLPLASSTQAQPMLASHAATAAQSSVWLSGYLFYPWPEACAAPAGADPQHARGHWLQHKDWPAFCQHRRAVQQWQPLPPDCRLAPLHVASDQCLSSEQLQDWLSALAEDTAPRLLAGLVQQRDGSWREVERVMLLNDLWLHATTGN